MDTGVWKGLSWGTSSPSLPPSSSLQSWGLIPESFWLREVRSYSFTMSSSLPLKSQ